MIESAGMVFVDLLVIHPVLRERIREERRQKDAITYRDTIARVAC